LREKAAGAGEARGEFYSTLGAPPASHVDAHNIATALTEPIDRHGGRIHLATGPAALT
jgi:hypothetical protein